MEVKVTEQHPLKWPEGFERTRIRDRKPQASWKGNMRVQIGKLTNELRRMGATDVLITYNQDAQREQDPGIAVYFSRSKTSSFEWQDALGIDSPVPTIAEIDEAFKAKALQHHPDRGGDAVIFTQLSQHRKDAIAWVKGEHTKEHEFVIPCDRYNEQRLNVAAIRLAVAAFRALDRVGIPGILERSFRGLRTALPAHEAGQNVA